MFQPPTKCGHVMFFEIEYLHNRCEKWNGYMPLINQPVGGKKHIYRGKFGIWTHAGNAGVISKDHYISGTQRTHWYKTHLL